jgi:cation:H+ antiporter
MMFTDLSWSIAFFLSLIAVLFASDRLVYAVEAAGDRYSWTPGLVGLLAAAGADGPEVSAAFIALGAGAHDISLGVIVGSNLFNLAAVLAFPILLVGFVAVQRRGLLLNGGAMVLTTLLAAGIITGTIPLALGELLVLATLLAYAVLLVRSRESVPARPSTLPNVIEQDAGNIEEEERAREREADIEQGFPSGVTLLWRGGLATAVIIGGCDVLVHATLYLGPRLGIPATFTGTFALAALTSLPNVWVATSLARRHRGAVLVSAVCNSNTINMVAGICLPALFATFKATGVVRNLDIPALVVLTLVSVALIWRNRGIGRYGAAVLVAGYMVFAIARIRLS